MRFSTEWLDAPGVRNRVLAATWARLEVTAADREITDLVAADTRRTGIYGSVMPLVEWLVENWWSLLYEASPISPLVSGRDAAQWALPWVRRHNLLGAREGLAFPDVTIARDGDEIVLHWVPDPPAIANGHIRFVGSGHVRVPTEDLVRAAGELIERTLQRLADVVGSSEEVRGLRDAWTAIQTSDVEEQFLCRAIAMLGGDPYDPDGVPAALLPRLNDLRNELSEALLNDLLEASTLASVLDAAGWIESQREYLGSAAVAASLQPIVNVAPKPSAHATGYVAAQSLRTHLGLSPREPVVDFASLLAGQMGWDGDVSRQTSQVNGLDGLVGYARVSRRPTLLSSSCSLPATRFRMARAAYFTSTGKLGKGRLLTQAVTRDQRAARAFAAEFLAPASALEARVRGVVGESQVAELAEDFNVSPLLIEHQIRNHKIGTVSS